MKALVAGVILLAAGYALGQSALIPLATFAPQKTSRTAVVYSLEVDGATCYVLDSRRGSALYCVPVQP